MVIGVAGFALLDRRDLARSQVGEASKELALGVAEPAEFFLWMEPATGRYAERRVGNVESGRCLKASTPPVRLSTLASK
jgi:hypothetical protein